MTKKNAPKRPKVVWVGNTPITPITARESRKINQRTRKRREKLRKRYPEIHGRVVDYLTYSIDDGALFLNVTFKDRTIFSLRFACEIFIVGADFGDSERRLRDYARLYEANSEVTSCSHPMP